MHIDRQHLASKGFHACKYETKSSWEVQVCLFDHNSYPSACQQVHETLALNLAHSAEHVSYCGVVYSAFYHASKRGFVSDVPSHEMLVVQFCTNFDQPLLCVLLKETTPTANPAQLYQRSTTQS